MTTVVVRRCRTTNTDISLHYETFGTAGDTPLLLIQGLNTNLTGYPTPFCKILASMGHYVVRFDNRDVGKSSKLDHITAPSIQSGLLPKKLRPKPSYTLEDLALDAVALMDKLELRRAHVAGFSMGGMIAQLMAIHHPKRVASAICIDSSTSNKKLPTQMSVRLRGWRLETAPLPKGTSEVVEKALVEQRVRLAKEILVSKPHWNEAVYRAQAEEFVRHSPYRDGLPRQYSAINAADDRTAALRNVTTVPFLVLHGAMDILLPLPHGKAIAEAVPGAELHVYDQLGHNIPPELYHHMAHRIARFTKKATTAKL